MPKWEGSEATANHGGSASVVLKGCEYPAQAAEFAAWLNSSEESMNILIGQGGLYPAAIEAFGYDILSEGVEYFGDQVIFDEFAASAENVDTSWTFGPTYDGTATAYSDGFASVAAGESTLVEVADRGPGDHAHRDERPRDLCLILGVIALQCRHDESESNVCGNRLKHRSTGSAVRERSRSTGRPAARPEARSALAHRPVPAAVPLHLRGAHRLLGRPEPVHPPQHFFAGIRRGRDGLRRLRELHQGPASLRHILGGDGPDRAPRTRPGAVHDGARRRARAPDRLRRSRRAIATFRLIYFLPYAIPGVIAGILWSYLYGPNLSPIVKGFAEIGITVDFLGRDVVLWSIANIITWSFAGYNMLIALSALQSVPRELYEAAKIDGANEWQVAMQIKLPHLRPALILTGTLSIIGTVQIFNEPQVLSVISPFVTSEYVPTMAALEAAFGRNDFGIAAATSVLIALFAGVLSAIYYRLTSRQADA